MFLATQQAEGEHVHKEEEERVRKEAEEKVRREKETEEKNLEEARLAEIARKADEDRMKAEEEKKIRKAAEVSERNQKDVDMAVNCEWGRLSPLLTSWLLLSLAAEQPENLEQPKSSGSRVRSRTPVKKCSAPSVGELPIPCWTCEKKGELGKCAQTG